MKFLKFSLIGLLILALAVAYLLASMALKFQVGMGPAILLSVLGIALLVAALVTHTQRLLSTGAVLLPLVATLIWWNGIAPSNDRIWAPELARSVSADISGSVVTLHNVRDFTWRSQTDFDENWETHSYDLKKMNSLDVALSYWGIDKIAHVLISFGFEDGEHVVFSVEIRKELGESFSELGGLFKQFELSLIAATEDDILFLRTNARDPREDVYLYPINVSPPAREALFMSYVQLANQLAEEPYWYNTITANCTSVIYRLVRSFNPDLGFDPRFILSGGLPEFLVEEGMLAWEEPLGDYRTRATISAKAQAIQPGESYSDVIRTE
ncbi:DUF4105 domain-containing protein [uncultured Shimia sp.]|uniref:Lnb N-terminal periplasmic domain-containing protein n=1 Tax=uncultured Shimia sp. TaxID=573152 RepID=UPI00262F28E3|nr:DUF4105 domain-containing protein [uncultured Shimia sp.]